mgnify:CR=1 FL=1
MELAARIVDPTTRHQTLRAFARYWFLRMPPETRAWLQRGGLSETEAEAMIAELTQTRAERLGKPRAVPGDRGSGSGSGPGVAGASPVRTTEAVDHLASGPFGGHHARGLEHSQMLADQRLGYPQHVDELVYPARSLV